MAQIITAYNDSGNDCPDCGAALGEKSAHRLGRRRLVLACARCGFEDATTSLSRAGVVDSTRAGARRTSYRGRGWSVQ